MVKEHNVLMKIQNSAPFPMNYVREWYDSGRVADGFEWPQMIRGGEPATVLNYERNWSLAGCSGYVTYNMAGTEITIGFSNPSVGTNKVGVGTEGSGVWENMESHDYQAFRKCEKIGVHAYLHFHLQCSGGDTNNCDVTITYSQ